MIYFFVKPEHLKLELQRTVIHETMINHQRNFQLHRNTGETIDVNEFSRNHLESESLYVIAVGSSPN